MVAIIARNQARCFARKRICAAYHGAARTVLEAADKSTHTVATALCARPEREAPKLQTPTGAWLQHLWDGSWINA